MKSSHRIKVLGKEITVRSSASPEQVQKIESLVNRKLAEAQASVPVGDPQIPVILALMNLAEGYVALAQAAEEQRELERAEIIRLSRRIDRVLS
ncbi:cell division protein ZapA [Geobacter pickeringii]|uniref:Cell division protein ZapA n=1 Tax=Geobacter pickeringii TaxID=345632 RepID=A0A0B5BAP8_9BACT|nr:cell division protein ZapA [Geobacter pickeringii]AJE03808.1 cell division protein ZapA [Geobacter pickeringii]